MLLPKFMKKENSMEKVGKHNRSSTYDLKRLFIKQMCPLRDVLTLCLRQCLLYILRLLLSSINVI